MNKLLETLQNLDFPKQTRNNVGGTYEGFVLGRITSWAGKGDKAGYRKVDSLKTGKPKYKEVHKLAVNVMKKKDPKFPFTSIQFNKNKQMKKHKDAKNVGESYIIGLGNYTGGELIVYNTDGKSEKKRVNIKNKWYKFDGSTFPHETAPFTGTRYTLVYYKN